MCEKPVLCSLNGTDPAGRSRGEPPEKAHSGAMSPELVGECDAPLASDVDSKVTDMTIVNLNACPVDAVAKKKKKKKKKAKQDATDGHEDDEFDRLVSTMGSTSTKATLEQAPENNAISQKSDEGRLKTFTLEELDNSDFRLLGNWPAVSESRQSFPPTIQIHKIYKAGEYPEGEVVNYVGDNAFRMTNSEKKQLERILESDLDNLRRAAECHRQTRKYVQSFCRPGLKMIDICQRLEAKSKELIAADGLSCGWGFPTGCSINHVAAHYTPNYGDDTVLQKSDIVKLDFGVQVAGRIIDCAFTIAFDPMFDPLIKVKLFSLRYCDQATQDGTNVGLKCAGIDVPFSEIGREIQEAIESYEMEINGQIHAGKSVPIVKNSQMTRMEEGELYAIETFASTGKGRVIESGECSHYMRDGDIGHVPLRLKSSKALLHAIDQNFGTLAFCRRWLDDLGHTRHQMALRSLVDSELVVAYPPLSDVPGSFTSQMEHTVFLRPTCKEILSRGPDY